jgi:uncharacterized protein (DUF4213/DUF364 family)
MWDTDRMIMTPITQALITQLEAICANFPAPAIAALHVPADLTKPDGQVRDAAFCAIELKDAAFCLSYLMLGDKLRQRSEPSAGVAALCGADPLTLARRFASTDPLDRALALACINALTDSVWRRVGYVPPPAGNSLGDIALEKSDHRGMIGFFPPLVRQVQALDGRLTVIELDRAMVRRQQARFPSVDITLDRKRLASCNKIVGTSTMLLNDTLDAMLAAAPQATQFAVIGPSAGLWPGALFERGVTLMGGTRIVDGPGFRAAMANGASWSASARKFAIRASDWPGWRKLLV